jgi:GxxExxY protein
MRNAITIRRPFEINEISGEVVDGSMRVHSALGPGLLESTYGICLTHELRSRSLTVATEVPLSVVYRGVRVHGAYRLDMLVENAVVVELKAVKQLHPIHEAQMLSYLKLSGRSLGLIINFNVIHLKDGIKRMVNLL